MLKKPTFPKANIPHPSYKDSRLVGFIFDEGDRPFGTYGLSEPLAWLDKLVLPMEGQKFALGDRVTKIKGSKWTGHVVGFYSTKLTPIGYAVESETETGSVQIYPEAALAALPK